MSNNINISVTVSGGTVGELAANIQKALAGLGGKTTTAPVTTKKASKVVEETEEDEELATADETEREAEDEEETEEDEDDSKLLTTDEKKFNKAKKALTAYAAEHTDAKALKILAKFGVKNVGKLTVGKYDDFMDLIS